MEEEVPVTGEDDNKTFNTFLAHYDVPAYVRRGREVEAAADLLAARLGRQRDEWLGMVRLRLGLLKALAGEWAHLRPHVAGDEQLALLAGLHDELSPRLRGPVEPTTSARRLRAALAELRESVELFNRRWLAHLEKVDLGRVNALREGYNRYYVLEKECAMRNPRLARQGFRPLPPLTVGDLLEQMPPLPMPG